MEKLMMVQAKLPVRVQAGEGRDSSDSGEEAIRFNDLLQQKAEPPSAGSGEKAPSAGSGQKDPSSDSQREELSEDALLNGKEILAAFQAQAAGEIFWKPAAEAEIAVSNESLAGLEEILPAVPSLFSVAGANAGEAAEEGDGMEAGLDGGLLNTDGMEAGQEALAEPDLMAAIQSAEAGNDEVFSFGQNPGGNTAGMMEEGPKKASQFQKTEHMALQTEETAKDEPGQGMLTEPAFMAAASGKEPQMQNLAFVEPDTAVPTGQPLATSEGMLPEDLGQALADRLTGRPQTFEITLEPASLGKLTIRAAYEGGRASVSILASDPKTLEILNQRAADLAGILEERTGQETIVYTQGLYQESGDPLPYGNQERGSREQPQRQRERRQSDSFAQQLRLGLV